ncbi:lysophospholipid transporter LplT [Candidatus Kinetoplastibacterium galatii TCC219]|uniref:Lysophospholipid transporter LplT n=2 Tax=Candidatus Kinetoplastidibacterium galati TaxID=994695 RepID=M1LUF1_9PROT|nr:lysophospholipid transporter LplT [Candidatus Kinetoplastibacterium galatii TCC219]
MAAQSLSSLADNALFIAAIAMIIDNSGPVWAIPFMKWFFALAYVVLAPFAGILSDRFPKGQVMLVANSIKFLGCFIMLFCNFWSHVNFSECFIVITSYGLVGVGAAIYSPAKYGIVTEILEPNLLVKGNSWIEGLTVLSIIMGTCLGSYLLSPKISYCLLQNQFISGFAKTKSEAAIAVILIIYLLSSIFNILIKKTNIQYPESSISFNNLTINFYKNVFTLWNDKIGKISLSVTTVFWGVSTSLQIIVLDWSQKHLRYSLDQTYILIGIVAIGTIIGAILVAKIVTLQKALNVLPIGILIGVMMLFMPLINELLHAYILLLIIGTLAGFFVVPLNAILQYRGRILLSAGNSIAVQNFNEQLNVLLMVSIYTLLVWAQVKIDYIIVAYGLFVIVSMSLFTYWNHRNIP